MLTLLTVVIVFLILSFFKKKPAVLFLLNVFQKIRDLIPPSKTDPLIVYSAITRKE